MKIARFSFAGLKPRIGLIKNDAIIDVALCGIYFDGVQSIIAQGPAALEKLRQLEATAEPRHRIADVTLHSPIERPGKYLAIGMNYPKHVEEVKSLGFQASAYQTWFNKQTTCLSGPYDPIEVGVSNKVDYEVELGIVIGKTAKRVNENRALDHVFGYFVANDVSARDWQSHSPTFTLGKSFDTHGPIGPWIVTTDEISDPQALRLRSYVNGELRQDGSTADMIHSIRSQIAYLSRAFTLEPGDILATGTPHGVGASMEPPSYLNPGDVIRCEIGTIGAIENRVS